MDALLDDPVFFEPYRRHFSAVLGRLSIPIETYLRMMFLKLRYGLGYETPLARTDGTRDVGVKPNGMTFSGKWYGLAVDFGDGEQELRHGYPLSLPS